jgi:predicted acylesterase/phospholipase RssA
MESLSEDLKSQITAFIYSLEKSEEYKQYLPQVAKFIERFTNDAIEQFPITSTGPKTRVTKDTPYKKYKGLCVGVGGIRGLIEAGAIHQLWKRGQLDSLQYFAGCSAGSIIITMLAIGCDPMEILSLACAQDIMKQFSTVNFLNIPLLFGLFPNSILKKKIEEILILKLGYLPTFKNIYDKLGKYIMIGLYVLSAPSDKRKIFASHITTPNMKISDAITLSCGIPIIFEKGIHEGQTYIDAAFNSVVPIQAFQEIVPSNFPILTICLEDSDSDISTFNGYIMEVLLIALRNQDNYSNIKSNVDIIQLSDESKTISFRLDLSTTAKIALFTRGIKLVKELLSQIESGSPNKKEKND